LAFYAGINPNKPRISAKIPYFEARFQEKYGSSGP